MHSEARPLVSVCCTTFNHAPFLGNALDSILSQETDFPIEVIVRDDCSTDGTQEILKYYESQFPELVKGIYYSENQYSKGVRPMSDLLPKAGGKYIALCEGDDYWRDQHKLQIQIDYLESHPEIVVTGHDAIVVDAEGGCISESKLPNKMKKDFTSAQLVRGEAWLLTLSMVFRNVGFNAVPEWKHITNGDKFILSMLGRHGGSHHHTDIVPGAYRAHDGGVWSKLNENVRRGEQMNSWYWTSRYYRRLDDEETAQIYFQKFTKRAATLVSYTDLVLELLGRLPRRVRNWIRNFEN